MKLWGLIGAFILGLMNAAAAQTPNAVNGCIYVSSLPTLSNGQTTPFHCDVNGKLLTASVGGGTVTSVSVVSANGFAGTVATATTTPAITLSTTITGILSGNGTAISAASTTGSGAVVLANTPTLITPVIGAATGTSLSATWIALGGAAHANPLDVTGAATISGTVSVGSLVVQAAGNATVAGGGHGFVAATVDGLAAYVFGGSATNYFAVGPASGGHGGLLGYTASGPGGTITPVITWTDNGPIYLTANTALVQLGGANVATGAIAQTITAQANSGNGGTSPNFTIAAPSEAGTTSTGGSLILTGGTGTSTNGSVVFPLVASDAAATDTTACLKSSDGTLLKGSGTLGICLGTSSARYKLGFAPLEVGLPEIMSLPAQSFYLDAQHGDPTKQMYGFTAEDCVKVLPKLVGLDDQNRPNTCDYLGIVPVLVRAMQQQQAEIDGMKARLQ